jgi:cell division protein FtsI/penicillin-binding protein 2
MSRIPLRRLTALAILLVAWGLLVAARLAQLQIARAPGYRARAQRQQERRIEVAPHRGHILDREGRELAISVESFSVYAIPSEVKDVPATARRLAALTGAPAGELASRMRQGRESIPVLRKLEPVVADRVRKGKLPGIRLIAETKRFYPKGPLAAGVLGYVGTDDRGLGGLEHLYDQAIRGKPGEIVALKDARLSVYGEADSPSARPPSEGASLTLSLDAALQFAAEKELSAAVEAYGASSGVIVLMDPWNGEILAMASAPGFDPNHYNRFPPEQRRNRAVADAHEPGSTFKMVTAALALEDSLVNLHEIIETGDGTIRVADTVISEHDNKQFGPLTLGGVFEHSSNVGIIRVGLRMSPARLYQGARSLGVGQPTGVDLPGENPGIFRPLSRWSALSAASISMGQEVALTPLQVVRITAAIANGGLLVTPRIVRRITEPDGTARDVTAPPPVRVLSEETARKLRGILVGVVERGTGTRATVPGFVVGGKTGTAQKAGPGGYQPGRYIPAFTGFAPAEDPRLVCVVVIEEPRGKRYYASEVAAPVFSSLVSQALTILRVPSPQQRVPSTMLASGRPRYPAGFVPAALREPAPSAEPAETIGETPDARGLSARQALALFARSGIAVQLRGTGFVIGQVPAAGSPVRTGQVHQLQLAESIPAPVPQEHRRTEETSPPLVGP